MNAALAKLLVKVTGKMVNYMDQPFTKLEISYALDQMCHTNAPSLG